MAIGQRVTDQSTDQLMPRGSIVIKNDSGSFKLKKGIRLVLIDCSNVTCDDMEGQNELTCINCTEVTVSGGKDAVVRIEGNTQVQSIKLDSDCKLNLDNAQVQELDLTKTEVNLLNCKVQTAKFTKCDLQSYKNKYEELTISGGQSNLDQDEPQKITTSDDAIITTKKLQAQGDCKFENTVVSLQKAELQGDVTITDCRFTDNGGQYQKITASGDKTICVLLKSQTQGDLQLDDGSYSLSQIEPQGDIKSSNASINIKKVNSQGDLTIDTCNAIFVDCQIQGDIKATSSGLKSVKGQYQKFTGQDGALDSDGDQFQGEFSQTGGNVKLKKPQFSDKFTLDQVIAFNTIYKATGATEVMLTGDGDSSIEVNGIDGATQVTVNKFSHAKLSKIQTQTADLEEILLLNASDCQFQSAAISDVSTLMFQQVDMQDCSVDHGATHVYDGCQLQQFASTDTNHLLLAASEVTQATVSDAQLVTTCGASDLTFLNCIVSDSGSTITSATDCTLSLQGSIVVMATDCTINLSGGEITNATACVINNSGGDVTADVSSISTAGGTCTATGLSTVMASACEVTNLGGLTIGTGFDPSQSSGALMCDGTDVTLQATLGELNVFSIVGNINITATALGINEISGTIITRTAGTSITDSATTTAAFGATGETTIDSGAAVFIGAPATTIDSPAITLQGLVNVV